VIVTYTNAIGGPVFAVAAQLVILLVCAHFITRALARAWVLAWPAFVPEGEETKPDGSIVMRVRIRRWSIEFVWMFWRSILNVIGWRVLDPRITWRVVWVFAVLLRGTPPDRVPW
jgi:hypothetical protein